MAKPPLPIDYILGLGETPDERFEILERLWWLTPKGLAEREQVTRLLTFTRDLPQERRRGWHPVPPHEMIAGDGRESEASQAIGTLSRAGFFDEDVCWCFFQGATDERVVPALRAAFGGSDDDGSGESPILPPKAHTLCLNARPHLGRWPDRDGLDTPPAPSSDPGVQLALNSPAHQVIAFGFGTVLDQTSREQLRDLIGVPLRELAQRLKVAYQERWIAPWRATNPERVRQFQADYDEDQASLPARITASFAPLHEAMERQFGTGRVDAALLQFFPDLRDRLIGDTVLADYFPDDRRRSQIANLYPRYSMSEFRAAAAAVERRLEATFGPDFRRAPA